MAYHQKIQQSTESTSRVERGCDDSTIDPDNIATNTNGTVNKTQQSTKINGEQRRWGLFR